MKRALTIIALSLFATACKKGESHQATVERDCTGVYLSFKGNDYHVCNESSLDAYKEGDVVDASIQHLDDCTGEAMEGVRCMMARDHNGWIKVLRVK